MTIEFTQVTINVGRIFSTTQLTWGPGLLDMGLIGLPPPSALLPHPSHQIIITKSQIGLLPRALLPLFDLPLSLSLDPQRSSNHSPTNLFPFSRCPCLISSSCNAIYPHQAIFTGLPNPPILFQITEFHRRHSPEDQSGFQLNSIGC